MGGAAVVLHLEGEGRVGGAVGVGGRGEPEQVRGDVGRADELAGDDGDAVVGEAARAWERGDPHGEQRVGRRVIRVGEAEVGDVEGVGGVFERGDPIARARRRVVDRHYRHGGRSRHRSDGRAEARQPLRVRRCIETGGIDTPDSAGHRPRE